MVYERRRCRLFDCVEVWTAEPGMRLARIFPRGEQQQRRPIRNMTRPPGRIRRRGAIGNVGRPKTKRDGGVEKQACLFREILREMSGRYCRHPGETCGNLTSFRKLVPRGRIRQRISTSTDCIISLGGSSDLALCRVSSMDKVRKIPNRPGDHLLLPAHPKNNR